MHRVFTELSKRRGRRGVTLVEAIVATVVLSVAVAAVSTALIAGTQQAYASVDAKRATQLAQAMMEEILAQPYNDPEGATGFGADAAETSRADFDNIDDYHGLTETTGTISDKNGNAYPNEYASFGRNVTITSASMQPAGFSAAVTGVTITVSVTQNDIEVFSVSRFSADPDPSS